MRWARRAVPGLLLALASALHPPISTDAVIAAVRIRSATDWPEVHLLLLGAVVALDASLLGWADEQRGWATTLAEAGIWLNAGLYSAFLGVDGFGGWILARGGDATAVQQLFSSVLVAGLGWAAAACWLVAAAGLALSARRAGRSMVPALLLAIGATWTGVSHAPPFGVVGGAAFALAGAWSLRGGDKGITQLSPDRT